MKFKVNGNEIEVYRDVCYCTKYNGNYYYTVFVKFGDYEVEVLEEYLGLALSNIDNIEKFKEFINKYENAIAEAIRKEYEAEEELCRKLEEENFIKYLEEKAIMEEVEEEERFKVPKGFGKNNGNNDLPL